MRHKTVKTLWILSGLIFAAVLLVHTGRAVLQYRRMPRFLKHTKNPAKDISQITIERFFFEKIVLDKKGDVWRMTMPEDYAVQETVLKDMTDSLASAVVEEKISERKDRFLDFELDEARGIKLTVKNVKEQMLFQGKIGKQILGSWDRSYFAFDGSSAVYVVKGLSRFSFEKRPQDIKSRLIFEAPQDKISSIAVAAKNKTLVLIKEGAVWKIRGKPVKQDKASAMAGIFTRLEANDFPEPFETAGGLKKLGLEGRPKTAQVQIKLNDGKTYEILIGEKKDTMYFAKLPENPAVWKLADWKVSPLLAKEAELIDTQKQADNKGPLRNY
ncbi:MAG: DUF4340 domain-containing protein [Elusimicrobia bacterium]|nr:DUF4340 domain-containing protein [Elusimicrobiota bacterium]